MEERAERVREFLSRHDLDYPVVLKPDAGQRGSGVAVIRDEERLEAYLAELEAKMALPATDPFRFGAGKLVDALAHQRGE